MPSSTLIMVADAVVKTLNAAEELDAKFEATREYRTRLEPDDLSTLRVIVLPAARTPTAVSRGSDQKDSRIAIVFVKGFDGGGPDDRKAEADLLMGEVEEVETYMRGKALVGLSTATWLSSEQDPAYSIEHFEEGRFYAALVLTYRMVT